MSYVNKNGSTYDEATGRWTHNFSQSFIGGFQTCPEQARASYFGETPHDDHTDSTACGTACHSGIEYLLYDKLAGVADGDADLHTAIQVAHNELDEIGEWKYTKLSKKSVYAKQAVFLGAFVRDVLPLVQPRLLERGFKVPLYSGKHRDVNLVGTMDCEDVDGLVWDWKTGSRPYERWEKQRWAVQPTVYCYASQVEGDSAVAEFGVMQPADFRYAVMLYDGSVQILDVHRNQSHVDWLKKVCSQIAWMIEHEVNPWPLNDGGWWCSDKWCPKWDECKGAVMLDGWMAAKPA